MGFAYTITDNHPVCSKFDGQAFDERTSKVRADGPQAQIFAYNLDRMLIS